MACQICGKKGHITLECYHRNNFSYQGAPPPASIIGMTAQGSNSTNGSQNIHEFSYDDTWVVETGVTHHMTTNIDVLNNLKSYKGDAKIIVGSGEGSRTGEDYFKGFRRVFNKSTNYSL